MNTREKIKFKLWIKAAGIRAIKTMAQAAIAMIGTSVVIADVDWKLTISASTPSLFGLGTKTRPFI